MKRLLFLFLIGVASAQRPNWVTDIRNGPFVDVRSYGAKGDNVNDDTQEIKNAIASGAKEIFLPPGTYKVTPDTTVSTFVLASGQSLRGAGPGATIIRIGVASISPQGQALIAAGATSTDTSVLDLAVDGNAMSTIQHMIAGITGHVRLTIRNVRIFNSSANYGCITIDGAGNYSKILDSYIDGGNLQTTNCHGIRLIASAAPGAIVGTQVSNVFVKGGNFGLYLDQVSGVVVNNFSAVGDGTPSQTETLEGINCGGCTNSAFSGLYLESRGDSGFTIACSGTTEARQLSVSSVVASNNLLDGVFLGACEGCVFSAIEASNNGNNAGAFPSQRAGIHLESAAGCDTTGNRFWGARVANVGGATTQQWGIRLDETAGTTNDNEFHFAASGNTAAPVLIGAGVTGTNLGTGTRFAFTCTGVPTSSATLYMPMAPMGACTDTVVDYANYVTVGSPGIIRNLRAQVGSGTAGGTITVTLQIGVTPTTVTCQIAAGGTSCLDETNTAAVIKGDGINVKIVTGAGVTGDGVLVTWEM